MQRKIFGLTIALAGCFFMSANGQSQADTVGLSSLKFTVEEAPEWSNLFKRQSGWFGADGIYTIPLNGKANKQAGPKDKVLFIFSDTMVGEIRDGTLMPGAEMIHNSVAVLKGNKPDDTKMTYYWPATQNGKPLSVFEPKTPNTKPKEYYWLGAGFVNQKLHHSVFLFGYRIFNESEGAFGFREVGNTLIKFPAKKTPIVNEYQQMDTPFHFTDEDGDIGSFGTGIYVNTKKAGSKHPDGYLYLWCKRQSKKSACSTGTTTKFRKLCRMEVLGR